MTGSLIAAAVAFAAAAWLTYRFSRLTSIFVMLDRPNERSLHATPTPRTGGVAIILAIYFGAAIAVFGHDPAVTVSGLTAVAASTLLVGVTSFIDDRVGLPVSVRFPIHLLAAGVLVYSGLDVGAVLLPGWRPALPVPIAIAISIAFIVWMINLYNFMDGMDGFAGGMSVIGFGTFAWLGWSGGQPFFAGLNLVIAAAGAGFLLFNFPPARIFMGDSGSSTLGLAAAAMSLWAQHDGLFPLWIGILVFSPFIVDATVTLTRRLFRGEKVWQAHKTHYYQRLVQLGWGHRKTVLGEYALMLACAATAVWVARRSPDAQWSVLGAWTTAYLLLALWVARLERRAGRAVSAGNRV